MAAFLYYCFGSDGSDFYLHFDYYSLLKCHQYTALNIIHKQFTAVHRKGIYKTHAEINLYCNQVIVYFKTCLFMIGWLIVLFHSMMKVKIPVGTGVFLHNLHCLILVGGVFVLFF